MGRWTRWTLVIAILGVPALAKKSEEEICALILKQIPSFTVDEQRGNLNDFMHRHHDDLRRASVHPGGPNLLGLLAQLIGFDPHDESLPSVILRTLEAIPQARDPARAPEDPFSANLSERAYQLVLQYSASLAAHGEPQKFSAAFRVPTGFYLSTAALRKFLILTAIHDTNPANGERLWQKAYWENFVDDHARLSDEELKLMLSFIRSGVHLKARANSEAMLRSAMGLGFLSETQRVQVFRHLSRHPNSRTILFFLSHLTPEDIENPKMRAALAALASDTKLSRVRRELKFRLLRNGDESTTGQVIDDLFGMDFRREENLNLVRLLIPARLNPNQMAEVLAWYVEILYRRTEPQRYGWLAWRAPGWTGRVGDPFRELIVQKLRSELATGANENIMLEALNIAMALHEPTLASGILRWLHAHARDELVRYQTLEHAYPGYFIEKADQRVVIDMGIGILENSENLDFVAGATSMLMGRWPASQFSAEQLVRLHEAYASATQRFPDLEETLSQYQASSFYSKFPR
jgi:hypothetical protein